MTRTYMGGGVSAYIYIYIYTHAHTHTHIYIYMVFHSFTHPTSETRNPLSPDLFVLPRQGLGHSFVEGLARSGLQFQGVQVALSTLMPGSEDLAM